MSVAVATTTSGDDRRMSESATTSNTLRQRRPITANNTLVVEEEDDDDDDDVNDDWFMRRQAKGANASSSSSSSSSPLSAQHLLSAQPLQYGTALKLHIPLIYRLSPLWLKQCLLRMTCTSPHWKSRFLIVLGSFVYRFVHSFGKSPKGSPLPVRHLQSRLVSLEDDDDEQVLEEVGHVLKKLPSSYRGVLEVTYTGGRSEEDDSRQYYAFATVEEAAVWHRTFGQARQEAIRREMGHTAHVPYPAKWQYLDKLGQASLERSERIQRRMEEAQWREMEMTTLEGLRGSRTAGTGMGATDSGIYT